MTFKFKGFDELQKNLNNMQKAAKELENTKTVALDDLFVSSFMQKYTNFSNFDEFLKAGNFIVNSTEDFKAISDFEMDTHVSETTKFSSWQDMIDEAKSEYIARKLGFK